MKNKNPRKFLRSVGEGGTLQFDIVEGQKGIQADNVTIPVQSNLTTTKIASGIQLDEVLRLKWEQVQLMEELQETWNNFTKEMEDMKDKREEDLRAIEEIYLLKLEDQKVLSEKVQREQEESFQKKLEAQEETWKMQKETETCSSWIFTLGGVCAAAGFLAAKYLDI